MKKAIHFGAGNIGRGFIGELLVRSGYEVTFVDVNAELVDLINERHAYDIKIVGDKPEIIHVEHVRAINSAAHPEELIQAICEADIITTAIGPNILKFIAPNLAAGLAERVKVNQQPLNVIACENMVGGSTVLKGFVEENLPEEAKEAVAKYIGFPDAAVDRIVPLQKNDDPLLVQVEPYAEWDANVTQAKGEPPQIEGLTWVENLEAYIERKLFTVNTGHASIAYLAYRKGIKDIYSAMQDKNIVDMARKVWQETGSLLVKKFGFDPDKHEQYVKTTESRFRNPHLSDEVTRVARGPKRKLGAADRLVSPATQLIARGQKPAALATVIGAAFHFDYEGDKEAQEVQGAIQEKGLHKAILNYTQIPEESELFRMVENKTAGF
ncbi:mannitol-1-phosphate 5-dehydrogenase [Selenomonas ruminantium]|uniref:Mannitol-1-phosphate 5-dehydrogenase n=1 Tax=Selenomonas ruminantium TaxID=971 RepID=A0A1I0W6Y1_SELRU|nr:mannitol-1-phosphate 5-dehydrogenase [Selenomonas ruminantium]SFA84452.1 mannitol-1-phosphate 5-dehydrogenase [Selenomonas ruminantium]